MARDEAGLSRSPKMSCRRIDDLHPRQLAAILCYEHGLHVAGSLDVAATLDGIRCSRNGIQSDGTHCGLW